MRYICHTYTEMAGKKAMWFLRLLSSNHPIRSKIESNKPRLT